MPSQYSKESEHNQVNEDESSLNRGDPEQQEETGHPNEQNDVSPGQSVNARGKSRGGDSEANATNEGEDAERLGHQENLRPTRKPSREMATLMSEYLENPPDTDSSSEATRVSHQDEQPHQDRTTRDTIDDEVNHLVNYIFGRKGRNRGQPSDNHPQGAGLTLPPSHQAPNSLQPNHSPAFQRDLVSLQRIATQRAQHASTVGEEQESRPEEAPTDDDMRNNMLKGMRSLVQGKPLPDFGAGKPYPPKLPEQEEYVVEFSGPNDPTHPHNWPLWRK